MRQFIHTALIITIFTITGCASHTHELPTSYVSPVEYQDFSCKQLRQEMARVSRRASEVAYDVNKNADGDQTAMAVGLILFWPSLFFIDGDSPQAQEYSRLKGQYEAIEQSNIQKNCGIEVQESPFKKIEEERQKQQNQYKDGNKSSLNG